jgi:hypothetical protein
VAELLAVGVHLAGEAAATGAHFATATEIEIEVAEMLRAIVPNAESLMPWWYYPQIA